MWHEIFVVQVPVAEKVLRTVFVYATIVLLFRLSGKRGLASLNTLDFVVIFLLANVVQNAIIGNDTSFTGGVIGAVTLVAVNAAVNRLVLHSPWAARLLGGQADHGDQGRGPAGAGDATPCPPCAGPRARRPHPERRLRR